MKRTYQNSRKISVYVVLIAGFFAIIFSMLSLLLPEKAVFSVIALIFVFWVCLELLISLHVLMVPRKLWSRMHAWLIFLLLVQVFSLASLFIQNDEVALVFTYIADAFLICNFYITLHLFSTNKKLATLIVLNVFTIIAMVSLRIFLDKWFLALFFVLGLVGIIFTFAKKLSNQYAKCLLLMYGILISILSVFTFVFELYDFLFPVLRTLLISLLFVFSALVLETPQEELPVMIAKSEEDYWKEKYNRMLSRKYKKLSEQKMLEQPVSSLKTITEDEAKLLEEIFGIKTVKDLATNPYFLMAKEIKDEAILLKKKG